MGAGEGLTRLSWAHRVLIGVVVFGVVVIAGIGFAGSYAAVRELAVKKGFGDFSYVFPIGIDAGICVLLALDLLLTWIRIPFPLLRQTAWLLTAATIAFNGAAAWPDPLGVGMHGVIPILFVVAVEAARHAIGRIADITADKHMEGVRLTRWLLSPVPTFLLWRRMKLWELRSYDQVIKLEQERLVYQASLRSRYGRAWRRKAPVEALMPLRLARFGVPLAQTALAGLAAAGIEEPPVLFTVERISAPADQAEDTTPSAGRDDRPAPAEITQARPAEHPAAAPERPHGAAVATGEDAERFADAYQAFLARYKVEPTPMQWALWLRDVYGVTTAAGNPLAEDQVQPLLLALQERYAAPVGEPAVTDGPEPADESIDWYDYFHSAWLTYAQEHGAFPDADALAAFVYQRDAITGDGGRPITGDDLADFVNSFRVHQSTSGQDAEAPTADSDGQVADETTAPQEPETASAGAQAAKDKRSPRVDARLDPPPGPEASTAENTVLTTADRYYLGWMEYQAEHGAEPTAEELSAHLALHGTHGRGGKPVSPANLRRYFLPSRVYNVWAEHRTGSEEPDADAVARHCAAQGITGQYNKPITTAYVAEHAADFERRWQALTRHHADVQHG
ncbi:hypothetical protein GCM10010377_75910 [Streptomyces viridiviolaceus]|uniref:DUF2637 domain-containing protein n=1 Tax=Streptomyces viridiviolaceus TaxID=68282 RepID=A0ABW2DXF9_9ACTN|nr:DUF2637 domain-containing protein [Streptomyces viridiviolaceus]GHB74322.1 hypothetical protein GCM10010377_75910 [Streptomyces viridiviolaceus]